MSDGQFTADNITFQRIDAIAFVLKRVAKTAETVCQQSLYGEYSPHQAAQKINELFDEIQVAFKP